MRLLMLFGLVLMLGCQEARKPAGERLTKDGYSVIVIEGCEYIEVRYWLGLDSGYYSLTHKGNCSNPIHCHTAEARQ